jgi:hypothetical protein
VDMEGCITAQTTLADLLYLGFGPGNVLPGL